MNVTIVKESNGSVIIEWVADGTLNRGIIPYEVIRHEDEKHGYVDDGMLSLALPYGIEWDKVLTSNFHSITPERMAHELRMRGLWTIQDLRSNPQKVFAALQSIYGLDFQTLLMAAENYVKLSSGGNR